MGKQLSLSYRNINPGRICFITGIIKSRGPYDPSKIRYEEILRYFFRLHDPTTLNQQGNDRGTQYRSAIFYQNEEQRKIAQKVLDEVDRSGKWKRPLVTEIVPATEFYPAEGYHQDYLKKIREDTPVIT